MKYMLIAGEASGDLHASHVIERLRARDADSQFVFFGGDKMAAAAGVPPVVHMREMAYMGFSEVLRNLCKIRRNLKQAKNLLHTEQPDCLILIDYPSFNLKVAAEARRLGIKVYYYISPKVWAWKEWRVRTMKRVIDRMFVIFPFEVDWFRTRHQMDVQYVGNPSVAELDAALEQAPAWPDFIARHGLRDKPIIALLPGSRRGEIKNNLPVMLETARVFIQYQPVVSAAPGIDPAFYEQFGVKALVKNDTMSLLRHARAAMVTSGTATLEAALARTPQVACYRANGSKLSYNIMHKLLSVDYVTLPNLILNREAIPEKLVHLCTPMEVATALSKLTGLTSPERIRMLADYKEIREKLGTDDAADNVAAAIIADLSGK